MSLSSSFNLSTDRRLALCLAALLLFSIFPFTEAVSVRARPLAGGQIDNNCRGLHAGIRAEFVKRDPSNNQTPFVEVSFILLNDGDTSQDTSPGTWTLVIDGKESSDSGMMFGNGPQPRGGWRTLNPGETAELGKALEVVRYFPEVREYKLSWRGVGFQSPTIAIKMPADRN